jgi:hypothetical protein
VTEVCKVSHCASPLRRAHRLAAKVAAVTLAVTAALTATTAAPAAAATGSLDPLVGVQFHGMWSDYTDAQRASVLDQLAAAHVGWVRLDVSWAMLQPDGPDAYSTWGVGFVDDVVDMAAQRGLKVLVTLWLTPAWANGGAGERTLPTDPADYARAARWAAGHFAGRVQAWEVWNEPNQDGFMTGASPRAYTRLLQAAYPAFHAGDPTTQVVFGGPAYNDTSWIGRAYANGVHGSFDVMATHPYMGVANQAPETPDDGTMWTLTHVAAVKKLMDDNGDGDKPIWFTEFGWSSHSNETIDLSSGADNWLRGVTAEQQGDYFVRTVDLVKKQFPYVKELFWYTERNVSTSNIQNANYGLLTHDLQPKPAYSAIKTYLEASQLDAGSTTTEAPATTDPVAAPVITTGGKIRTPHKRSPDRVKQERRMKAMRAIPVRSLHRTWWLGHWH